MKNISIDAIPVIGKVVNANEKPLVISKPKKGKKLSFAIKVSIPVIQNILGNADNIGEFLGLELDPITQVLTLHFEKKDVELEKELAHEMR